MKQPILSICTTVKNRSRLCVNDRVLRLLPNCVESVRKAVPDGITCQWVVSDWDSDDWPLDEWIAEAADPLPVEIVRLQGVFSRGRGRNLAAASASSDWLLFLDADCLIGEAFFKRGLDALSAEKAFFPVVYSFSDPDHVEGWWRRKGYGNCMINRTLFDAVGGFPEYDFWGQEDRVFFQRVEALCDCVREEVDGFFHQWHPDEFEWKNRFGNASPIEQAKKEEDRQTAIAASEVLHILSSTDALVLVDDALLEHRLKDSVNLLPFVERDGQYWGLPADSANAIVEIERLRMTGASLLAFAWPAFWWFDHYAEFHTYLCDRFRLVLQNERLVIFDLKDEKLS